MRWPVVLVLLSVALAGCLGTPTEEEGPAAEVADLELPDVPENATVERTPTGAVLEWVDVDLPLYEEIEIPDGVTAVHARADVGPGQFAVVRLYHSETSRRRCNPSYISTWTDLQRGGMSCSGLTVIDALPTNWTVSVSGPPVADTVHVELSTEPLDGPVADLDLDAIDPPVRPLQETTSTQIESFDGTELYAEVTLPDGEGPWPTIIASSPYNGFSHTTETPSLWHYFVQDWAKRGYAVVVADVRGTGFSGGCMEVWGPNEQRDQKALVEWAASQDWSDGHVGFYGQSYVGTTPVEAAVQSPDALDAIIAVAPVINAYDDWHFGGVPNGENIGSPLLGYQISVGTETKKWMILAGADPVRTAMHAANGVCDPTLTARANDPRAIYDEFYEVRNFSARADQVDAAVMYTHGFEDPNVKSQMATWWFNEIDAPKLGVFGHWTHQHPPRTDSEALMLAWIEEHVKGKDLGLDTFPEALIRTDEGTHRTADAWPPEDPATRTLWPDLDRNALADDPRSGERTIRMTSRRSTHDLLGGETIRLRTKADEPIRLSGRATVQLDATLEDTPNAYVAAYLYDVAPDGEQTRISFGMANLAHRNGHEQYDPVPPGERVSMPLHMLPTDHVIEEDHWLKLVVRSNHRGYDWGGILPGHDGHVTIHGGEDGTRLELPIAPGGYVETPWTAAP